MLPMAGRVGMLSPGLLLLRRRIVPPEMPDGQEGKYRRVNKSGEQEGRKVQRHRRVVGPHPNAEKGIGEGVPEPLGCDQQPQNAPTSPKATGGAKARIIRLK